MIGTDEGGFDMVEWVDLILMYITCRDKVTKMKQFAKEGEFSMYKAA